MEPFKDTINVNAHFYLDDGGEEIERTQFVQDMFRWNADAFMIYVGAGYCPLKVAVFAHNASDAYSTFEEWARNTDRYDEIGEGEDQDPQYFGDYESTFQTITQGMIRPLLEFEYASATEWLIYWLNTMEDINHMRRVCITMAMHLDADTIQDDFERAMDEMGYFTPKVKPIPEE